MKIKTWQGLLATWFAVDQDKYDGPGSPLGMGYTEDEAIDDLMEQLSERAHD